MSYTEADNSTLIRKTIYMHYLRELNFWGHTRENQGFQMFANYWIGHAHNIYLQYATDFGLFAGGLFAIMCISSIIYLVKCYINTEKMRYAVALFLLAVPLLFGILEFSWGSGSITIILLFICWRQMIIHNSEYRRKENCQS